VGADADVFVGHTTEVLYGTVRAVRIIDDTTYQLRKPAIDAGYIKEMKQYATEHGYASDIDFKGAVNDIHQRLKYYDVGLMCSRSEGFGLVTAEYMHAGLGVIASNSGACPEIVDDGVTGLLFESGNPVDLAKCIQLFYNDRALLENCGRAAKQKAKQKYTDVINSQNIRELYKELTQKKDYR
jgi:glycosyltransferase involved in cell wall biosynthesis